MAFVSAAEIVASSRGKTNIGKRRLTGPDIVTYAVDFRHEKSASSRFGVRIEIGINLLSEARFILGDSLDVLIDSENRKVLIKRNNDRGWRLTSSSKHAHKLQIPYSAGIPSVKSATPCSAEVTDQGIVFTLPECASFTENLREKEECAA